jgi:hypothetical protein
MGINFTSSWRFFKACLARCSPGLARTAACVLAARRSVGSSSDLTLLARELVPVFRRSGGTHVSACLARGMAASVSTTAVLLYVPNLIGYVRLVILATAFHCPPAVHTHPRRARLPPPILPSARHRPHTPAPAESAAQRSARSTQAECAWGVGGADGEIYDGWPELFLLLYGVQARGAAWPPLPPSPSTL